MKKKLLGACVLVLLVTAAYSFARPRSLFGRDADGNGVRDDIDAWIDRTYPKSARARAALKQLASDYQYVLSVADDREKAKNAILARFNQSLVCADQVFEKAYLETERLEAEILNTYERSERWLKADGYLSGTVIEMGSEEDRKSACRFDLAGLGN